MLVLNSHKQMNDNRNFSRLAEGMECPGWCGQPALPAVPDSRTRRLKLQLDGAENSETKRGLESVANNSLEPPTGAWFLESMSLVRLLRGVMNDHRAQESVLEADCRDLTFVCGQGRR
jgi:hypothetical protein